MLIQTKTLERISYLAGLSVHVRRNRGGTLHKQKISYFEAENNPASAPTAAEPIAIMPSDVVLPLDKR
jgi:hypothetical protein